MPMDDNTLRFLASLGVGGVLAGTIASIYRKDSREWQDAWKGQSQMLLQVVKENTAAITALTEKINRK